MSCAIYYSSDELAWIESHSQHPRRDMHANFCKKFGRNDISLQTITGLCKRNGWLTGRTGQFAKGIVPANKGKKMPFNANSAKTQFKKGSQPHNTKPLGHERTLKDGYVWINVAQENPYTGFERRYVQKHRHLWQQENGAVPKGMCLKCLDGNKSNCEPSNWEAIPRAMLPGLNGIYGRGYDAAAPELKPVIMQVTKLEHKARTLKRGAK